MEIGDYIILKIFDGQNNDKYKDGYGSEIYLSFFVSIE